MSDPQARQWRVPVAVPAAKFAVSAILVVVTVTVASDAVGAVLGLVVAGGLGLSGLRDLLSPVRLEADHEGVTVVSGLAGRHRHPWAAVERIRVDQRRRLLGRSTMLEIDVDPELYFLTRYELGSDPTEVAAELQQLQHAERRGS